MEYLEHRMSVDAWTRYQLRRKLFSIGEDFWIENDRGEAVYKVDGKVLRIRETFVLEDVNGTEQATVEAKLIAIRPTMNIERGGQTWATVKKALFTLLRQHFTIEVQGGPVMEAQGDILNHEYEITSGGQVVPRSPSGGSRCWRRMASPSPRARMRCSCWPLRCASTRCRSETESAERRSGL